MHVIQKILTLQIQLLLNYCKKTCFYEIKIWKSVGKKRERSAQALFIESISKIRNKFDYFGH